MGPVLVLAEDLALPLGTGLTGVVGPVRLWWRSGKSSSREPACRDAGRDASWALPLPASLERRVAAAGRRDDNARRRGDIGPVRRDSGVDTGPLRTRTHRLVSGLEQPVRRRLAFELLQRPYRWQDFWLETALTDHVCGWSADEAEELFVLALRDLDPARPWLAPIRAWGVPVAAVAELDPSQRSRFAPYLRCLLVAELTHPASLRDDRRFRRADIAALFATERERALPAEILHRFPFPYDLGHTVRCALGILLFEPGVLELVAVCAEAYCPRPSTSWLGRVRERLEGVPAAPDALRALLSQAAGLREDTSGPLSPQPIQPEVGRLFAGVGWAACLTGDSELIGLLGTALLRFSAPFDGVPRPLGHVLLVRGAAAALSAAAGDPGVGVHRRALPGLSPEAVAQARHALAAIVADVPQEGIRDLPIGRYTASFAVRPHGAVFLEFRNPQGRVLTRAPSRLHQEHAGRLAALRRRLPMIRAKADRARGALAELLAIGADLTGEQWCAQWLDDDIAGPMSQALVWQARSPARVATGLPLRTPGGCWLLRDPRGGAHEAHEVAPGDTVRLWRAGSAEPAQAQAWRALLREQGIRQPVPQLDTSPRHDPAGHRGLRLQLPEPHR